jgi:hypothetical protein
MTHDRLLATVLMLAACTGDTVESARSAKDARKVATKSASVPGASQLPTVEVSRVGWEDVQSLGGLRVHEGVRLPDGTVLLPVQCDVSGLQAVTVQPREMSSSTVVTDVPARLEGGRIRVGLCTGRPGEQGVSSLAPAATLSALPAGVYPVDFENPDGSTVSLGNVEVPPAGAAPPRANHEGTAVAGSHCLRVVGSIFDAHLIPAELTRTWFGTSEPLVGFEAAEAWTPTPEDGRWAEQRIVAELLHILAWGESSPSDRPPEERALLVQRVREVTQDIGRYGVQFAGGTRDGRRVLLGNFFDAWSFGGMLDKKACDEWVDVRDGGASFWRIQVDMENGSCSGFETNGDA